MDADDVALKEAGHDAEGVLVHEDVDVLLGVRLDVSVDEGDRVAVGEAVAVLEAVPLEEPIPLLVAELALFPLLPSLLLLLVPFWGCRGGQTAPKPIEYAKSSVPGSGTVLTGSLWSMRYAMNSSRYKPWKARAEPASPPAASPPSSPSRWPERSTMRFRSP